MSGGVVIISTSASYFWFLQQAFWDSCLLGVIMSLALVIKMCAKSSRLKLLEPVGDLSHSLLFPLPV